VRVITNSSPLCYLILIDQIQLIHSIFKKIHVPEAFVSELDDAGDPPEVRKWIPRPPEWLRVQKVLRESDPQLDRLHVGERDAILLAHWL